MNRRTLLKYIGITLAAPIASKVVGEDKGLLLERPLPYHTNTNCLDHVGFDNASWNSPTTYYTAKDIPSNEQGRYVTNEELMEINKKMFAKFDTSRIFAPDNTVVFKNHNINKG